MILKRKPIIDKPEFELKTERKLLLRLNTEQTQIIRELRRKYPHFFDSESHVLRVALLYYYNKKIKNKTDPIEKWIK